MEVENQTSDELIPVVSSLTISYNLENVASREVWRKNAKTYRPTYRIEIERVIVLTRTVEENGERKEERFNPRSLEEVLEDIEELADNLLAVGQLEPLEGDLAPDGDKFYLRHGERRYRAMMLNKERGHINFDMVEVRPYPVSMTEGQKLFINLSTDQKKKYKPMDLANGLYRLKKDFGLSNEEIGVGIGKSRQWVDNQIKMVEQLSDEEKEQVESGELKTTKAIKRIHEKTKQADEFHGVIGKSNQINSDNVFIPKEEKSHNNFPLMTDESGQVYGEETNKKEDALPSINFENFKTEQEDWVNQIAKAINKIEALGAGLNDGAQKDLEREMWIIRKNAELMKIYFGNKANKDVSKFVTIDTINELVKLVDSSRVSDGYHTFGELYEHIYVLFIALCKELDFNQAVYYIWRSKLHSDGTSFDGEFTLGINQEKGKQITYHLPLSYWEKTDFADDLDKSPEWDGHTSADIVERINKI